MSGRVFFLLVAMVCTTEAQQPRGGSLTVKTHLPRRGDPYAREVQDYLFDVTENWPKKNNYPASLTSYCKTNDGTEVNFELSCRYTNVQPKCVDLDKLSKEITQDSAAHIRFKHYVEVIVVCEDMYYKNANYAPDTPEFYEFYNGTSAGK